ncbi:M48 family metallopeptidase [Geopsychrobacter electrodiphilus]|uniref:M48 family metallopeptidase n=1 Tax=Geopsychrobacter electrodiphilus TaxID=225196 RepID=UPI00036F9404|nr:M48 family metallopeptidase [Geopsychrobacter electrodiphilus]
MITLIIFLYLAVLACSCWLHLLNNRHLHQHGQRVPAEFEGAIDPEVLAKSSAYTLVKGRVTLVQTLFDSGLTLLFVYGGLLVWYDGWLAAYTLSFISAGLIFFVVLSLAKMLLDLPFDLYNHFKVESRFGFNRMSFKLWCVDLLKSLLLSTLFFILLGSAAFWLIQAAPASWWLWVWGLVVGFSLLMMVISPYVIEPLFFKFEPLKVEGLEENIREMMGKAGLSVSKVLQVDASKRSGHSNAYFTGIGKQKRVVLFDTLLAQLSPPEILAVLAHELGHMKKKHILKRMLLMAGIALFYCWLAHALIDWPALPLLVGISSASFYARLVILFFLSGILTFPLTPLFSSLSRRDEYAADRFACALHGNSEDLATALIKMSKENLANLYPHPSYARFYYSHPPVVERVRSLRSRDKG